MFICILFVGVHAMSTYLCHVDLYFLDRVDGLVMIHKYTGERNLL
jgi:hypothetical protein